MSGPAGTLKIRDPGPVKTVQDAGRLTARRWGVPVARTLVPDWLCLANALVGNGEEAAGLEFRLTGPRFTVETDAVLLAVGGPAEMKVEGAEGVRSVPPWTATRAERGDRSVEVLEDERVTFQSSRPNSSRNAHGPKRARSDRSDRHFNRCMVRGCGVRGART